MRIKRLINKLKNKKSFKDHGAKAIFFDNLQEKFHEEYIRALQWLISILNYLN